MNIYLAPKTKAGKASLMACLTFVTLLILFFILIEGGQKGGAHFLDNLILAIPLMAAAVAGIMAMAFGMLAILRYRERSVLTLICTLVGIFVFYFTLGELMGEH